MCCLLSGATFGIKEFACAMGERLVADQKLFSDAASSTGAFPNLFCGVSEKAFIHC